MTADDAWTQPATADANAICDRLDAIHALLETLVAREGSQGIGWDGTAPPVDEPPDR